MVEAFILGGEGKGTEGTEEIKGTEGGGGSFGFGGRIRTEGRGLSTKGVGVEFPWVALTEVFSRRWCTSGTVVRISACLRIRAQPPKARNEVAEARNIGAVRDSSQ